METGDKDVVDLPAIEFLNREREPSRKCHLIVEHIPVRGSAGNPEIILHLPRIHTEAVAFPNHRNTVHEESYLNQLGYHNFVEENPDGLYRLDLNGNFLHGNRAMTEMAGRTGGDLLGQNFFDLWDVQKIRKVKSHFRKASGGKITSFEAGLRSRPGKEIILKILLMPMFMEGEVREIHGIAKDVTELRRSRKEIVEKNRFLEVHASFINNLLERDFDQESLQDTFQVIAETISADRMYYFGADRDAVTGEILISQKVEWCSDNATPQIENPDLQRMPLRTIAEITAPLVQNLPFVATLSDLKPGMLKDIFEDEEIKSMLLLPIFVEEQLHGFIGFDDCSNERHWKEEEISFLKTLTQNLTNAFEKQAALEKAWKSEKELKISERKFRALVQEGSDLIGVLDLRGRYIFTSDNYKNLLGLIPQELIGQPAADYVHPEDFQRVQLQFEQLRSQKQVNVAPFRIRNNKGEYRWFQTVATNMLREPAVRGIVINSRDITTIIEQAREIEHINERYQLAATATQDLIYDWDLKNRKVTRFHRSREEFFGYTSEEVNKDNFWLPNMHPEDRRKELTRLLRAFKDRNQNYIRSEFRFRRADGSYARIVDKGYILRDCDGNAIRLIGAASDISELTAKKEALRIANQRFKMAMKATNEMIWDWDITTDSVVRSNGYKKIFGYDTEIATTVHSFWIKKVARADREKMTRSLQEALADPGVKKWRLEYRIIKADGTTAFVSDRGFIFRDEKGNAIRMVGAVLDVTHSRTLLRKIQRQNKLLKKIAWEQSHLVRAPLVRIQGLLDLLEEGSEKLMTREEILLHLRQSACELDDIIRTIVTRTEQLELAEGKAQ